MLVTGRLTKEKFRRSFILNSFKRRMHFIQNASNQIPIDQNHKAGVHYLQMRVRFLTHTYLEDYNKCYTKCDKKGEGNNVTKSLSIHRAQDNVYIKKCVIISTTRQ